MCIYICIDMQTYIYIYVYIYIYIYILCVYTYMYVYTHIYGTNDAKGHNTTQKTFIFNMPVFHLNTPVFILQQLPASLVFIHQYYSFLKKKNW